MKRQKILQLLNLGTFRKSSEGRQTYKFVFVLLALACLQFAVFSSTQAQTETREKILIVTTDEINGVGIPSSANKPLGDQYNKTVVDEFEQHAGNAETKIEHTLNDGNSPAADFYKGYDIVIINSVFATIDEADRDAIETAILNKDSNVFVLFIDSCSVCSAENRSWLVELVNANAKNFQVNTGQNSDGFTSFPLNTTSSYAKSFEGLNPMYGGYYTPFTNVPVNLILYKKDSADLPTEGTGEAMAVLLPLDEAKGSCMFATYDGTMFHDDPNAYTKNQGRIAPTFLAAARGGSCFAKVKQADLSVAVVDPPPVDEKGAADYTITVTNNGPDAASNTQVQVDLPTGFALVTKPDSCSETSSRVLTCSLGEIASGNSQEIKLNGTVNEGTGGQTLTIKASVSSDVNDPALGNNTAEEDTLVNSVAPPAEESTCTCTSQTVSDSSVSTEAGLLGKEISIYTLDNGSLEDSVPEADLVTQAGVAYGNPQTTADRFGNPTGALYFDGQTYIQTNEDSNFVPLTFSVWFRADDISGARSVVDSDVSGKYGHSLIIGYDPQNGGPKEGDGTLDVQYHDGFWNTDIKIDQGKWYHVAVVYETDKIKLYLGSQTEEMKLYGEEVYNRGTFGDGDKFRFGRHNSGDPQWFKGAMDDIRFYDQALTVEQLQEISDCTCLEPAVPDTNFVCPLNSAGDVHITTPDGLVYDFQERNDFILSRSTNSNTVMLQARQEPWPLHPNRAVAVNAAIAMNVSGDILEFYLKPQLTFYVNGNEASLPASQDTLTLSNGGAVIPTKGNMSNDFTIFWPGNHTASRVRIYPNSHMDACIKNLDDSLTYEGLLGNLDGVRGNDVHFRDGETAQNPPIKGEPLNQFGDSWIPREGESLFHTPYPVASNPVLRNVLAKGMRQGTDIDSLDVLTINDFDPAARAEAEAKCTNAGVTGSLALYQCTYDLLATESETFIEGALSFQESIAGIPDEYFASATDFQGLPVPVAGAAPSGEGCYWQSNVTGEWEFQEGLTFEQCYEQDSCSGGLGQSGGGCYKWAEGPDADPSPWENTEAAPDAPVSDDEEQPVDEPVAPTEPTEEPSDKGGPLSGICASATILPMALGMVGGWGMLNGRRRKKRNG